MSSLHNPIRSLPCDYQHGIASKDVVVEVREMTWDDVNVWHSVVQPIINSCFQHWQVGLAPEHARADVGWDWALNYSLALLHNTLSFIPGNKSGKARALALVLTSASGEEIPIGLLTVVPQFQCSVNHISRERTFAWFLADAPRPFYTDVLNIAPVKGVATALLDCAIQSGFDAGSDGETLLHADPRGGQKLMDFYRLRCSMGQVSLNNGPISTFRRKNVNQYFFMRATDAQAFCTRFNSSR